MARQIVSHGHISVNGRRLKVPSYTAKVGDEIAVRDGSKGKTVFADVTKSNESAPKWLTADMKKLTVKVKSEPTFEAGATMFDYPAVFELYSR